MVRCHADSLAQVTAVRRFNYKGGQSTWKLFPQHFIFCKLNLITKDATLTVGTFDIYATKQSLCEIKLSVSQF